MPGFEGDRSSLRKLGITTHDFWTVRKILREPLLHFVLIGLALFLLYGVASPADRDSRRIVVSQSQVDDFARQFQLARNRPPSDAELSGLVETFVRDEIIYREGLALRLDKDDAVIKRRVRQKYDLFAEEEGRSIPTDAELSTFLRTHPALFAEPPVVSFDQIYFDPASNSPKAVAAVKAELLKGANSATLGQASMLPRSVKNSSIDLVERDFGDDFAREISTAPVGTWVGPLFSGIGVHLVRVNTRSTPRLPPLDQVRKAVAREWESDRRSRSRDDDYRKLRQEYRVDVEASLPGAQP